MQTKQITIFQQIFTILYSKYQNGINSLANDLHCSQIGSINQLLNSEEKYILLDKQYYGSCCGDSKQQFGESEKIKGNEYENADIVETTKKQSIEHPQKNKKPANDKNFDDKQSHFQKSPQQPTQNQQTQLPNPKLTRFKKHLQQKQKNIQLQKPNTINILKQKISTLKKNKQDTQQSNQQNSKISIVTIKQQNPQELSSIQHAPINNNTISISSTQIKINQGNQDSQGRATDVLEHCQRGVKTQSCQKKNNVTLVSNVVSYCRSQKISNPYTDNDRNISSHSQLKALKSSNYLKSNQKAIHRSRTRQKPLISKHHQQRIKQIEQFLQNQIQIKMQLRIVYQKKKKLQNQLKLLNQQLSILNLKQHHQYPINKNYCKKQDISKKDKFCKIRQIWKNNKIQNCDYSQCLNLIHYKNCRQQLTNRKKYEQVGLKPFSQFSHKRIKKNSLNRNIKCECFDFSRFNAKLSQINYK